MTEKEGQDGAFPQKPAAPAPEEPTRPPAPPQNSSPFEQPTMQDVAASLGLPDRRESGPPCAR